MIPSCWTMPSRSKSPHCSTILPRATRKIAISAIHIRHTTTRGREATQGAQVGFRRRETRHDAIRFGDDVLDRLGEVGERVARHHHDQLYALQAGRDWSDRV